MIQSTCPSHDTECHQVRSSRKPCRKGRVMLPHTPSARPNRSGHAGPPRRLRVQGHTPPKPASSTAQLPSGALRLLFPFPPPPPRGGAPHREPRDGTRSRGVSTLLQPPLPPPRLEKNGAIGPGRTSSRRPPWEAPWRRCRWGFPNSLRQPTWAVWRAGRVDVRAFAGD